LGGLPLPGKIRIARRKIRHLLALQFGFIRTD